MASVQHLPSPPLSPAGDGRFDSDLIASLRYEARVLEHKLEQTSVPFAVHELSTRLVEVLLSTATEFQATQHHDEALTALRSSLSLVDDPPHWFGLPESKVWKFRADVKACIAEVYVQKGDTTDARQVLTSAVEGCLQTSAEMKQGGNARECFRPARNALFLLERKALVPGGRPASAGRDRQRVIVASRFNASSRGGKGGVHRPLRPQTAVRPPLSAPTVPLVPCPPSAAARPASSPSFLPSPPVSKLVAPRPCRWGLSSAGGSTDAGGLTPSAASSVPILMEDGWPIDDSLLQKAATTIQCLWRAYRATWLLREGKRKYCHYKEERVRWEDAQLRRQLLSLATRLPCAPSTQQQDGLSLSCSGRSPDAGDAEPGSAKKRRRSKKDRTRRKRRNILTRQQAAKCIQSAWHVHTAQRHLAYRKATYYHTLANLHSKELADASSDHILEAAAATLQRMARCAAARELRHKRQGMFAGYLAERRHSEIDPQREQHHAACVITRTLRRCAYGVKPAQAIRHNLRAETAARVLRERQEREDEAAEVVQRAMRVYLARSSVSKEKGRFHGDLQQTREDALVEAREDAASAIQRSYRSHAARTAGTRKQRALHDAWVHRSLVEKAAWAAAEAIQRCMRCCLSRRCLRARQGAVVRHLLQAELRDTSAVRIQRRFRCYRSRAELRHRSRLFRAYLELDIAMSGPTVAWRDSKVLTIQCAWRGWRSRRLVQRRRDNYLKYVEVKNMREMSLHCLRTNIVGTHEASLERRKHLREAAALAIQKAWYYCKASRKVEGVKAQYAQALALKIEKEKVARRPSADFTDEWAASLWEDLQSGNITLRRYLAEVRRVVGSPAGLSDPPLPPPAPAPAAPCHPQHTPPHDDRNEPPPLVSSTGSQVMQRLRDDILTTAACTSDTQADALPVLIPPTKAAPAAPAAPAVGHALPPRHPRPQQQQQQQSVPSAPVHPPKAREKPNQLSGDVADMSHGVPPSWVFASGAPYSANPGLTWALMSGKAGAHPLARSPCRTAVWKTSHRDAAAVSQRCLYGPSITVRFAVTSRGDGVPEGDTLVGLSPYTDDTSLFGLLYRVRDGCLKKPGCMKTVGSAPPSSPGDVIEMSVDFETGATIRINSTVCWQQNPVELKGSGIGALKGTFLACSVMYGRPDAVTTLLPRDAKLREASAVMIQKTYRRHRAVRHRRAWQVVYSRYLHHMHHWEKTAARA